jgi:uncharacterized repeat protein (TIGR02543 family)
VKKLKNRSYGKKYKLPANKFKKTGYKFVGWNTKKNGTGTAYVPGEEYTAQKTITLYAQWKKLTTYAMKYNMNGASAKNVQINTTDSVVIIRETIPTRKGYVFVEWNTNKNGTGTAYEPGEEYTARKTITLYAIWKEVKEYTVVYDTNGAEEDIDAVTTKDSVVYITDEIPTREGYSFIGWNDDVDGNGEYYEAGDEYTECENITLYAQWEEEYELEGGYDEEEYEEEYDEDYYEEEYDDEYYTEE